MTGAARAAPDREPEESGHGLIGMQERLAVYGGELRTSRGRGGGFHVRARIPLTEAVSNMRPPRAGRATGLISP